MEFGRTMLWVAPLTVLIWVYAEREQIASVPDITIQIQVKAAATDRIATIASSSEHTLTMELEGPRVKLDALRQQLATGLPAGGLLVTIDAATPLGAVTRRTTDLLNNDVSLFRSAGVKVTSASPSQVTINVDELVSRELVVVPAPVPASVSTFEQPPVFTPSTVRVSGPRSVLDHLTVMDESGRLAIQADLSLAAGGPQMLRTPGIHELADVPLIRPRPVNSPVVPVDDPGRAAGLLSLSAERVRATIRVRQADVTFTIPSMPVFVVASESFLSDYRPDIPAFVTNVVVQGPPDVIAAIRAGTSDRKPKALLEIGRDDLPPGRTISRKLRYDLPDGVTVSAEDAAREVEFTLSPRLRSE